MLEKIGWEYMVEPLLDVRKLTKVFGSLRANDAVDLTIMPGEIHALLGENGAGKSTLVKMLYGTLKPDGGSIHWRGREVQINEPSQARGLGIGMVFQHFSLFDPLSAAENIALAMDGAGQLSEITEQARVLGDTYGLPIKPDAMVGDLSVGERQRIEIIRCLLQKPDLIILDEPTSVLTPQEVDRLFETLRTLRAEGRSILYISHKLDEVRALCDTATILRHGRLVDSCIPAEETASSLAAKMVGTEVDNVKRTAKAVDMTAASGPVLRVDRVSRPAASDFAVPLRGISFEVWPGEVVGVAGVAGNGQSELFEVLSGEHIVGQGAISINGTDATAMGPNKRRKLGAAFAPEERLGHGAVPDMTLSDNIMLSRHSSDRSAYVGAFGVVQRGALRRTLERIVETMDVRKSGDDPAASNLSGGNLQKVIMGREFDREPSLIIANQPTWGVDVGAAVRIRQGMIDLAAKGSGVLVISQDLDELLSFCDRIVVVHEGQLSHALSGDQMTREAVGLLMGGVATDREASHAH